MEYFQEHKQRFIFENLKKDLVEGIEQGYFRPEIKIDILAKMRLEQIEMGFDPHIFSITQHTLVEVQLELLDHFIRGVLTNKGTQIYNEYQPK